VEQVFSDIGSWLEAAGGWAYVVAPLLMAAVAILPIPAEAPAMLNGALFGPFAGSAVTWSGAMLGAVASYELGRWLGRPAVERFVPRSSLSRADGVIGGAGWWGLLLARLIPLIAFTALNWGAGIMRVDRWRFLWTTAVGILPGVLLFTSSGWGLARIAEKLPWVGTSVVVLLVLYYAARARARRPASEAPDDAAEGGDPPPHGS